jgi:hypothetical protein
MKPRSTNQHYVPQFLLRNFASSPGGKQIYVYDKAEERSFSSPIDKVASARAFYDFEVDGVVDSIDPLLGKLESATSAVIRNITQARSLRGLSTTSRTLVSLFAVVQMLRTEAHRKQSKALIDDLHDVVKRAGWNPDKVEGFDFLDEEEVRVASITSLRELARALLPHFVNKHWVLYSAPQGSSLYISDNPVALFNLNQDPVRSTLGLRVPGIQVYLPLSSDLCLGFLCPTTADTVRGSYELAREFGHPVPCHVESLIRALDGGDTLPLGPANVIHQNSLQVANAERFVFCDSDNFAPVREMIHSSEEFKAGPRSE